MAAGPPGRVSPLRLSWSRIRAHLECPAKGALLASGKKSPATDIRGYYHGIVVDLCMRKWLDSDDPQPGGMADMLDRVFVQAEEDAQASGDGVVRWKSAGDKAETLEYCAELVRRLEVILTRECLPYGWDPARRFTVPFTIPGLDGAPRQIALVGEIDLLVTKPAGVIVWDLKATRDENYWRKVTGQLRFYEIAVWSMTGKWPVSSGLIQPMCTEQVLTFAPDAHERTAMFTAICNVAADIWRGAVSPKVSNEGCSYCPVRHACPKFPAKRGRVPLSR